MVFLFNCGFDNTDNRNIAIKSGQQILSFNLYLVYFHIYKYTTLGNHLAKHTISAVKNKTNRSFNLQIMYITSRTFRRFF